MSNKHGTLYGLGLGPGDPELLTLKAARLLAAVPVIAYLQPNDGESMARAIAAPHLPGGQAEVAFAMPMRMDPAVGAPAYDRGAAEIAAHLEAGRDVAFLCEGDPFLFGSFMYVFDRLAAAHTVVTVPGVSSPGAAAAAAGLPLVSRNESLAVVPATLDENTLTQRLTHADAAVILKLGRHLDKARRALVAAGMAKGAVVVTRATFDDETVFPLEDAVDRLPYFSLILARRPESLP